MKPNNDTPAARGKWQKSLIVYYDTMGGILDELDDEQAGQLFKALFYYGWQTYGGGGDRHEVLDRLLPDFNMRALFAALKTQVDRDGEKWRRTVEKRAQAGRKGWEAQQQKTSDTPEHLPGNAEQTRANAGYTDTVTDTVTDTSKESTGVDEKGGGSPLPPPHARTDGDGGKDGGGRGGAAGGAAAACIDYSSPVAEPPTDLWGMPWGDDSDPGRGYIAFRAWVKGAAPYCYANMDLPTVTQFTKLKEMMGTAGIMRHVAAIENRKDLRKKYKNLYLTVLNWHKRERYGNPHDRRR